MSGSSLQREGISQFTANTATDGTQAEAKDLVGGDEGQKILQ